MTLELVWMRSIQLRLRKIACFVVGPHPSPWFTREIIYVNSSIKVLSMQISQYVRRISHIFCSVGMARQKNSCLATRTMAQGSVRLYECVFRKLLSSIFCMPCNLPARISAPILISSQTKNKLLVKEEWHLKKVLPRANHPKLIHLT